MVTVRKSEYIDQKTNDKDYIEELYFPGSFARETIYQISTYLAFLKVFINRGYPVFPLFVLDSVSQSFSKNKEINNLSSIRHLIDLFIDNTNVQVIWIDFDNEYILEEYKSLNSKNKTIINLLDKKGDYSRGFNPFHELLS